MTTKGVTTAGHSYLRRKAGVFEAVTEPVCKSLYSRRCATCAGFTTDNDGFVCRKCGSVICSECAKDAKGKLVKGQPKQCARCSRAPSDGDRPWNWADLSESAKERWLADSKLDKCEGCGATVCIRCLKAG